MKEIKKERKQFGRMGSATVRKAKNAYVINWLKENKYEQFKRNNELFKLARLKKKMEAKNEIPKVTE